MDLESANWCRLAQIIMHKGADVLRPFLLVEILTKIFTHYSQCWMNNMHNPGKMNHLRSLRNTLEGILQKSQNHSENIPKELLNTFNTINGDQMSVMKQILIIKQWKNDIEKQLNFVSDSAKSTLNLWLDKIKQDIKNVNLNCEVLNQWNTSFHCHLQNAQSNFLIQIEKNEGFLSRCNNELKSLSEPSSSEFQQLLQNFIEELTNCKKEYYEVLNGFLKECHSLGLGDDKNKDVQPRFEMDKFLNTFKDTIKKIDLQPHVNDFCGKWYENLHTLFQRYEKQIQEGNSAEDILCAADKLRQELEKYPSFKTNKIKDFFYHFDHPNLPKVLHMQLSKLKNISKCADLNDFDLTVILAVWKNSDFVHSPQPDCDDNPPDWDTTISADMLRLRVYRNSIVAHVAHLRISSDIFENLWKTLARLLNRIASRCGDEFEKKISWEIDRMKDTPLEAHRMYELRKEFLTWCKNDILSQLSARCSEPHLLLDMLQSIQTALDKLARTKQASTCLICNAAFCTESELSEHMNLHQVLRCGICNQKFCTEGKLLEHTPLHQAHTCLICESGYQQNRELEEHMRRHCVPTCDRCDKDFQTTNELERHMHNHKAFTCLWHDPHQTFSTEKELALHARDYMGFKCRSCNRECSTESELSEHLRIDHQAHRCRICDQGFYKVNELREHMLSHQARTCRSCRMDFSTRMEFLEHMRSHQARTCRKCNTDFSTGPELENHMSQYQARTCLSCREDFSTGNEIEEHMKSHQARTCRICNKDFPTATELENDIRDHKVRTCRICDQEYSTEERLAEHKKQHMDDPEGAMFGGTIGFLKGVF